MGQSESQLSYAADMGTINEWWTGDTRERYWMEITNRDIVGENLLAPQKDDGGNPKWSYELVRHVRPGDVVLHWRKDHGPAITGYSHCSLPAVASSMEWQSRGTYGRTHEFAGAEAAWEALLQGYRELKTPITLAQIKTLEGSMRTIRADLESTYAKPLYFPFAISDKRPPRAQQSYMVKFPAALVDAIPELRELGQMAIDEPDDAPAPREPRSKTSGKSSGYGRQSDPERRRAVEKYSVSQVMRHYESLGYSTEDVGATVAWDVTATRGLEVIHIEVKGSTTERLAVDITEGEVRHAEEQETVLIVIDRILMDASLRCSGGRWRYWPNWIPDRGVLIPTAYRHPLASGETEGKP